MFARAVVAAALVALPYLAQSAAAADCTRTYIVKEGDICDSISAANNVSTYQLAVINPKIDSECNNLQVGDTLCLGEAGEDCTSTYVVRANDDCDLIGAAHNVNATMLYANNPQIDGGCTNLYIGEVLCVANAFAAPSAPANMPAVTIPATATPAAPSTTSPAATPAPTDDGNDDDDDDANLPFCDEL